MFLQEGPSSQSGVGHQILESVTRQAPPAPPSVQSDLNSGYRKSEEQSRPIDPNQPQYRLGIGGRILGTLANFLSGMSGRGSVTYTGGGATNHRYAMDEEKRLRDSSWQNAQIANLEHLNEMNQREYDRAQYRFEHEKQLQEHQNSIAPNSEQLDPDTGKWMGITFGGEKHEVAAPQWFQQDQARYGFDTERQIRLREQEQQFKKQQMAARRQSMVRPAQPPPNPFRK